jgi:hypothetical protein
MKFWHKRSGMGINNVNSTDPSKLPIFLNMSFFKNEQISNLWSCESDSICQASFDFAERSFPTAIHICHLYTNENERQGTIAQFMQSGLLANESWLLH